MTDTVRVDFSTLHKFCPGSTTEWRTVCEAHRNVLLEGPEVSTDAVLLLLEPHLHEPVYWKRPRAPFTLPSGDLGAVVLQDIDGLNAEEQAGLLRWLDEAGNRRVQIVSTTAQPLFALVARRVFDEALYYRVNVMLLRLTMGAHVKPDASGAEPDTSDRQITRADTLQLVLLSPDE